MTPKVTLKQIAAGKYAIDVRGYTCPYPEIFTRRALGAIKSNDVLEITLDNAPSCETIPPAVEEMKNKVLEVTKLDQTNWKIVVRKS
ncbi:MAG: sulfurtransferase TusA family protein [Candidatus Hadarchaeota archaeon]